MSHFDHRSDLTWATGQALSTLGPARFLTAGESLTAGQQLDAPSAGFLALMRGDGDLVVYRSEDWSPVWSSGTAGHPEAWLAMQDDGDAVIHAASGASLWRSSTGAHPGAFLELCDDGRLLVRDFYRTPVWSSTSTASPQGAAALAGRSDLS